MSGEKNSSVVITGYRVAGVAPTTTLFYRYRALAAAAAAARINAIHDSLVAIKQKI